MPTHAETARYLTDDDRRYMIITSTGMSVGSYDHYVGKANFEHVTIDGTLDFASPVREGIWQSAVPTTNSWGFIINTEIDEFSGESAGWQVRGFAQMLGDRSLMPLGVDNVFFAEVRAVAVDTYEEAQAAVQRLDAERVAYNSETPVELREALVRLAEGTPVNEYADDRPTVEGLYATGGMVPVDMYVTFRIDGMTSEEASSAVTALV